MVRPYGAKHMPYVKYFQIATVKRNGRPANRTVVFRGFLGEGKQWVIRTQRHNQHIQTTRIFHMREAIHPPLQCTPFTHVFVPGQCVLHPARRRDGGHHHGD
jgi:hypothetical protein